MESWHSYPKLFNIGHKSVMDIFKDEVQIEEKVDGGFFQ